MHMADALVAPAVAGTLYVCSTMAAAYSVKKVEAEDEPKKIPLMGVMGAFVFSAQMINFTIPGTGASGHLCGGMLLTALLGPYEAFLTMIGVLLIQCLMFADGGFLALGCNIWNMAFYGCFVGYFLIWHPVVRHGFSKAKIIGASILGSVVALQLGAFSVTLETMFSGITELPFLVFVSTMQPIHLAIGFIEGLITAMVLLFVCEARPQMLQGIEETTSTYIESKCSIRKVITVFGIITLFTGGIFSLFASVYPDGLEWSIERISGSSEIETVNNHIYIILENIQKATAILADYGFKGTESVFGTSFSGIIGSLAVLGICLKEKENHMSKLDGALCDIHHIDISVEKNQWLNHMYPLIKLVVTMCFIIITVSFSKYDLVGILRMGVYPIVVFVLGEISFRDALKRIRVILPIVCLVGVFNPFFDRQPVMEIAGITVTTGIISMLTLMMKGVYSVLASYLLIVTTPIEKICHALRLLHVPVVIVTQILLTYRYVRLLLNEAHYMIQAYSLRAPNQKGVHFKVWGSLVGQLLLKSIDRADEVYASMLLRGYNGEFYYDTKITCRVRDYMYMAVWCMVFFCLRVIL